MKKFLLYALIAAMLFIPASAFAAGYAQGEAIVVMRDSNASTKQTSQASRTAAFTASAAKAASLAATVGARSVGTYPQLTEGTGKTISLFHSSSKTADELIAELQKNPDVLSAVRNYAHKPAAAAKEPNDELWDGQWGQKKIGAPAVWNKTTGSADVYVAVIDTGVLYDHPDLKANMCGKLPDGTYGKMFHRGINKSLYVLPGVSIETDVTRGGTPTADTTSQDILSMDYATVGDIMGHGTHVAGIIGSVGNNGIGTSGVCWNVKILPVGVFTLGHHILAGNVISEYFGPMNYDSDVIAGFNYIADLKLNYNVNIRAANFSVGDWMSKTYNFNQETNPVALAIKAACDAGIVVCIAAGNEAQDIDAPSGDYKDYFEYPATFKFDAAIAVGASTSDDVAASFSNYSTSGKWVDIFAPGVKILSTVPTVDLFGEDFYNESGYASASGTSMATPMAAGAVALLASAYPDKTAAELKAMLMDGADASVLGSGYSKYGRLNVEKAFELGAESSSAGCSAGAGALAVFALALIPCLRSKRKDS